MSEAPFFHRPQYAAEIARSLLHPNALTMQIRSGLFLSGIRRVGKTSFLRRDLAPQLEAQGAIVVYADLWSDRAKSPTALVQEAVKATLKELSTSGSEILKRIQSLGLGGAGFQFSFQVDGIGSKAGTTLADAFTELVDKAQTSVVLIVDEVQQALSSEEGMNLLFALKAARDAVNARPDTPGHLLMVGTGSHKSLVADMTSRRSQPFAGAVFSDFQALGPEYVAWNHGLLQQIPGIRLPSLQVMQYGFLTLGQRPEELQKAVVSLQSTAQDPDTLFHAICIAIAASAADVELAGMQALGALATLIFDLIAMGDEKGTSGLYAKEALARYSQALGTEVDAPQVQNMVDRMIAANFIQRMSHGSFAASDPLVRQAWRANKAMRIP